MKKSKTTHRMSKVMMVFFTLLFVVLFGRFFYIQSTGEIKGVTLEDWAEKKRTSSYSIDANRGKIVDRNGMTLAYDRPTYSIFAIVEEEYSKGLDEPKHVVDTSKTAEKLAPILNMDQSRISSIIQQGKEKDRFQVEFGSNGRYLSQEKRDKIKSLHLPGINFRAEAKRYYPNGMFASHVVGFAQRKGEDGKITGVLGIENQMDKKLTEKNGSISFQRDKYNQKLLNPEEVIQEPKDGDTIQLTLDQKIQTFLEDAMTHVQKQYEPKKMMAVVMDPKTGEVLASSNRPSFDPNNRSNIKNWYNDVLAYPFEPGSTMKIFTVAAAMDAGVYDGKETYDSGSYKIEEITRPIRDHYRPGWGEITYNEGIQRSSNVAAAKLVWEKLGTDKFLSYLKDFGFDQKTGIDLPGETAGNILYNWPIEKLTTSYGQGTTVTPMQLMKAATAVANDGKMMKPYVISKVLDPNSNETIQKTKPEVVGEPIDASTAKSVRNLLGKVVTSENGTGKNYKLSDFSVAGKTGTAQIPDPDGPGYLSGSPEDYMFSFLGMAPKEDPELMMYVAVKQPKLKGNELGSEPVSYIFKTVMENSLHYLNIQPDKQNKKMDVQPKTIEDLTGKSVKQAKSQLQKNGLKPVVLGEGSTIQKTLPAQGKQVFQNERVLLLTKGDVKMPNMNSWSLRDVLKFSNLMDMKLDYMGSGFVYKQSIQPGSIVRKNDYLTVELSPPGERGETPETNSQENERSMQEQNEEKEEEEA
ncbi:penicillin-binding protein [Pontibacillus sp. HMF3514]|uniref:penicillin-binding protein n=1 Tax=Pontibacillus sp. HMF3514 TaxID=2692425 RepID=UPI001320027C|nr:penicillin-binding protein [Pontibacillus sp. HMF3514]QHE52096.1 PASTA domain-containing protein [Pontibacillus sp. HMF3514]